MVRYLDQEEKGKSRVLWEEAFPEDSPSFLDYYYTEKTKNNKIAVVEEDGRIVSMAHVNPYQIRVGELLWKSGYLVAVATAEDRRHRGLMRAILREILNDAQEEKIPFLFLMPADEAIYLPFDFVYVFDQPKWKLSEKNKKRLTEKSCKSNADFSLAASYMEEWLKERYELYSERDEGYVNVLARELGSENGELLLLYEGTKVVGLRGYWGNPKVEERLLLASCEMTVMEEEKPAIMARITCLPTFLEAIRLEEDSPFSRVRIRLQVTDPIIASNDGIFLWTVEKSGSKLEKDTGREKDLELSISISELTAWLMGYRALERPEKEWESIRVIQNIYLDEIV